MIRKRASTRFCAMFCIIGYRIANKKQRAGFAPFAFRIFRDYAWRCFITSSLHLPNPFGSCVSCGNPNGYQSVPVRGSVVKYAIDIKVAQKGSIMYYMGYLYG